MKLQLLILCAFRFLVLKTQEVKKEEFDFDGYDLNSTATAYDGEPSPPCNVTVPGFDSLGLLITYIIVFLLSVTGNGIVVYVVCYMKKGRASTDIYLMHLALADLVFSLTLPFWAVYIHFGWIFGTFLCKLVSGFQEASVYSGVFLLACISVDRYFAIVRATRVLSSRHLLVKVVCSVVWLVAGVLSLPMVIQKESIHDEDLGHICYENLAGESSDHWRVSISVLRHTVGFFLPLTVMAVCYCWTVVTLFHTRNQQKHKAMRVILAVVLAFILCWLPYNITILIDTLIQVGSIEVGTCETLYVIAVMLNVTQVLAFVHCAVNPVLYAFIGEKFRNQLLLVLYKHGLISKRIHMAYRKSSVNSAGSNRSRVTSVTM